MPATAVVADDDQTAVSAIVGAGERDDQNHSAHPLWCSIETWQDYWASTACAQIQNDRDQVCLMEGWGHCERVWVYWTESLSSLTV